MTWPLISVSTDLRASLLAGEGCDCHHGAFLRRCGVEVDDGPLSAVNPGNDLVLTKGNVEVVVGVLALPLDTGDDDGEILDRLAEEMRLTVEWVLGTEVPEGAVGCSPVGLVGLCPGPHDEIGVAGGQRVEHCVVGCADGTAQGFLRRLAASQEAAGSDKFYPIHGAPSWSASLRGT